MRYRFHSIAEPKKAAKRLSGFLPGLKLSLAQQGVARISGYSDWHDLEQVVRTEPTSTAHFDQDVATGKTTSLQDVVDLASVTGQATGDIQYALSKSRLGGRKEWSHEQHVALRFAEWRNSGAIGDRQYRPGTMVRATGSGKPKLGYLTQFGPAARIMTDSGFADRGWQEMVHPRVRPIDFLPARLFLPYGYWTLGDDSRVVFSRDYLPMWHLIDGEVVRLPPWLWIEGIKATFHFAAGHAWEWHHPDVKGEVFGWMAGQKISGLPKLADVLPLLTKRGVRELTTGIAILANSNKARVPTGPWHLSSEYVQVELDAS